MKVKPDLFSFSRNLESLIAAIAGFIVIQVFSKHSGIGVSPDSVTYLSSARHMAEGRGFVSFDNLPTADFPFGYPFFLTIISFLTNRDPLQFGPVLNGILFGLLLYVSGNMLDRFRNKSGWYKRILLFCILMSPALQEVFSLLWSETIFLILILLFTLSISKYLRRGLRKWLFISTGICAFVCITRYAGVFLVITGCSLIFFNREMPWRKRVLDSFIFGSLSLLLLAVNIIRNLRLTGLATGPRPGNHSSIHQVLENFGGVLCDWLLVNRTPSYAISLTCIVLLIFAAPVFYHFKRRKPVFMLESILASTGLVYCLFMICTSALTRYEQFTNRLLSPAFIPLLCCATSWIPEFLSRFRERTKWIMVLTGLILAVWFLNIQFRADWEYYDGVKDAGIPGYQEDEVTQSGIVQYLAKNKNIFDPGYPIYSNAGDAVYFFTGLACFQLPFIEFPDKVTGYYTGFYDNRNEYLVWFNNLDNPEMPDLNSILKNKKMILLKQLADGAVYIKK